ncbi:MAG: glycosyltransferase family 2 protein [Planctomycetota bacterium]
MTTPRSEAPVLSVVIPSWNTKELTATCLEFLDRAEKPTTEVIIVENGSEDGSRELIAERWPEHTLLVNEVNEGFARGSNQGLRAARGEFVFLLNTDTEVAPDAIRRMLDFLRANPEYGAVAPKLVHPDGRVQPTVQSFPTCRTALWFATPLERWFPDSQELRRYFLRDWNQESTRDVDQPPAAALLLRKSVLDEVGLFDETLWLFYNDTDLALRMAQAGWKTRYLAEAEVVHHVGASTSKFARFIPVWNANRLTFYRKHYGWRGSLTVKSAVTWSFLDFAATQAWRRLRGKPEAEPVAPLWREYKTFLAS